jgi:hypothetical protein
MDPWPKSVFGFPVRRDPIDSGAPLSQPVVGVLHTVEGSTDELAAATFKASHVPSHFSIDTDSIIQFRSLKETGSALRHDPAANVYQGGTNAFAVQIEIAGFSKTTPWQPDEGTIARVAAVMAYASKFWDIPLVVPNDWPDDCHDMPLPWAARNARRRWAEQRGRWPKVRGWWMHMEVPGQGPTWHWDCGAMRRTILVERAKAILGGAGTAGPDDAVGAAVAQPQAEAVQTEEADDWMALFEDIDAFKAAVLEAIGGLENGKAALQPAQVRRAVRVLEGAFQAWVAKGNPSDPGAFGKAIGDLVGAAAAAAGAEPAVPTGTPAAAGSAAGTAGPTPSGR